MQLTNEKRVNNPYKKKTENGSQDRENITRRNLIGTYSIFWQLDISNSVSKVIVFLVLLFSLISVILKPLFCHFQVFIQ